MRTSALGASIESTSKGKTPRDTLQITVTSVYSVRIAKMADKSNDANIPPESNIMDSEKKGQLAEEVVAAATTDFNIVDFTGPDDLSDPMNRASSFLWMHVGFVSFMAFVL